MKKICFGIGLLMTLFALTPAYGQSEEAAIVLKDFDHPTGCFAESLTFLKPPGPHLSTQDEIHTVANSKGNVKLTCHFDLPKHIRFSRPIKDSGFLCGIYLADEHYMLTTRTTFVATPGGRATLTCEIKENQIP
jgi:hypothetical protein